MITGNLFGILASAEIIVLSHIVPALADVNSWSTNGPSAGYAGAIAVHLFDSQTIIMGSHNGFWKTTDGGANWFCVENDSLYAADSVSAVRVHLTSRR